MFQQANTLQEYALTEVIVDCIENRALRINLGGSYCVPSLQTSAKEPHITLCSAYPPLQDEEVQEMKDFVDFWVKQHEGDITFMLQDIRFVDGSYNVVGALAQLRAALREKFSDRIGDKDEVESQIHLPAPKVSQKRQHTTLTLPPDKLFMKMTWAQRFTFILDVADIISDFVYWATIEDRVKLLDRSFVLLFSFVGFATLVYKYLSIRRAFLKRLTRWQTSYEVIRVGFWTLVFEDIPQIIIVCIITSKLKEWSDVAIFTLGVSIMNCIWRVSSMCLLRQGYIYPEPGDPYQSSLSLAPALTPMFGRFRRDSKKHWQIPENMVALSDSPVYNKNGIAIYRGNLNNDPIMMKLYTAVDSRMRGIHQTPYHMEVDILTHVGKFSTANIVTFYGWTIKSNSYGLIVECFSYGNIMELFSWIKTKVQNGDVIRNDDVKKQKEEIWNEGPTKTFSSFSWRFRNKYKDIEIVYDQRTRNGHIFTKNGRWTLKSVMRKRSFEVNILKKLKFLTQLCSSLLYVQDVCDVVHRYICGRMIMVRDMETVCLDNFARSEYRNELNGPKEPRQPFASVNWLSPQEIETSTCTFESDVYSLSLTIWEVINEETPFANFSKKEIINAVPQGVRPDISDEAFDFEGGKNLMEFVCRGWDNNPDRRPACREFLDLLTNLRDQNLQNRHPIE